MIICIKKYLNTCNEWYLLMKYQTDKRVEKIKIIMVKNRIVSRLCQWAKVVLYADCVSLSFHPPEKKKTSNSLSLSLALDQLSPPRCWQLLTLLLLLVFICSSWSNCELSECGTIIVYDDNTTIMSEKNDRTWRWLGGEGRRRGVETVSAHDTQHNGHRMKARKKREVMKIN